MSNKRKYNHLYEIPVEKLELSTEAIKQLKRTGITSIGDCIDFYIRGDDVLLPARPPFFTIMGGEVKNKLMTSGYWSFVEDNLND